MRMLLQMTILVARTNSRSQVRNALYSDMHAFADVIVAVAPGETIATTHRVPAESIRRPPQWMPLWRAAVLGIPSLVLTGWIDGIGPIGPVSAALWLGLNWWLF